MFYSQCLLSRQGPLGAIWVAAYFYKKLKKSQVTATNITSSVDKILGDEFDDAVAYRILGYLLLGIVRIYSKKVEYMFDDCNRALRGIKEFVLSRGVELEPLRAPYFSITLPERFELDAFELDILEDESPNNVVCHDEITLKEVAWRTEGVGRYGLTHCKEFSAFGDTWSADYTLNEDIIMSQLMECDMEMIGSPNLSNAQASMTGLRGNEFSREGHTEHEVFCEFEEEPRENGPSLCETHQTEREHTKVQEGVEPEQMILQASSEKILADEYFQEGTVEIRTSAGVEAETGTTSEPQCEHHQTDGQQMEVEAQSLDLGISGVEKEHVTPVRTFSACHNGEKQTQAPFMEQSDTGTFAQARMQEASDDVCRQELCRNLESIGVENEKASPVQPCGERNQIEGMQIGVGVAAKSENEVHEAIKECSSGIENLREYRLPHQQDADTEMFCAVEEPHRLDQPFNEEHHNNTKVMKLSEVASVGNKEDQINKEDAPLSIKLDVSPQSGFPNVSGIGTPEVLNITTPATKERARKSKGHAQALGKRKFLYDKIVSIPNDVLKAAIEDPSDLVSRRRKAPRTALATWKMQRASDLPQYFLQPLIPCTSSLLQSLFGKKKSEMLKIFEALDSPRKLVSECADAGGPVENVEASEMLGMPECHTLNRPSEAAEPLEELNVETVAPPAVEILTAESHDNAGLPQNVSNGLAVNRLVGGDKLPEKLDVPGSPPVDGSSLHTSIAPQTPVLHKTSSRPFERQERAETSSLVREENDLENVEKQQSCMSSEQEFDLHMLTEEINSCEGDGQENYGWSHRTRVVARFLHSCFLNQQKRREEEVVNLLEILEGKIKKEGARFFYEVLVLKSKGCVHVKQENGYGDILLWKTLQWDQTFAAD
ncbi:hypothetical protein Tsubulata_034315 [Turnera subulata]|uniref:Rad21/Rec8-like protein N-terminal domain-containing protein n=1 Tax=Turnera subulata TaxID=218843 RepID=A0A9Q0JAP1_9ROSI|nr:hypothetical protein Tsubulata_034315 [Turnera subulata]